MDVLTKGRKQTQFNLRIDPDLLQWVRDEGGKLERPMNYMINHAIKQFKKSQELKDAKA